MKLKRAQDRLEALKKTSVGAKALADVTAEVCWVDMFTDVQVTAFFLMSQVSLYSRHIYVIYVIRNCCVFY